MKTRPWIVAGVFVVAAILIGCSVVFSYSASALDISQSIKECQEEGHRAQQCLNDLVVHIGKEKGLDAGFDALQSVYLADSDFAASCHGTTHELGSQAYDEFEKGKAPLLSDKAEGLNPLESAAGPLLALLIVE